MKLFFTLPISVLIFFLLTPSTSWAAVVNPFQGVFNVLSDMEDPRLTCEVEGTNVVSGSLYNKVTYKIKYTSNYNKVNANYSVTATVRRPTATITLYRGGGATTFSNATSYVYMQDGQSKSFTYLIKDNPSITVNATLDGVRCKSKIFTTVKPVTINVPSGSVVETPGLRPKPITSITLDPVLNEPVVHNHTCKVIVEGQPKDEDEVYLGAAIQFANIQKGDYPYVIRGFRSDQPNSALKFEGTYKAQANLEKGFVMNSNGKGFIFTYDTDSPNDSYIITANLGNIDCTAVLFPSKMKSQPLSGEPAPSQPVSGQPADNGQAPPNPGTVAAAPSTEVAPGVDAIGLDAEGKSQAENLNLVQEASANIGVTNDDSDNDKVAVNNSVATAPADNEKTWDSRDYTIAGLLGAILVAIIGYAVMKYRGMM